jgi:hypothetical protein
MVSWRTSGLGLAANCFYFVWLSSARSSSAHIRKVIRQMASDFFAMVVALGLAFLAFSWAKLLRRKKMVGSWPGVDAIVETVTLVNRGHYTYVGVVDLGYSYTVDSSFNSGNVSVPGNWWRTPPTDKLIGQTIRIRVNPKDPSESAIVTASVPGIDDAICPQYLGRGANR